jgi:hypothetical protein
MRTKNRDLNRGSTDRLVVIQTISCTYTLSWARRGVGAQSRLDEFKPSADPDSRPVGSGRRLRRHQRHFGSLQLWLTENALGMRSSPKIFWPARFPSIAADANFAEAALETVCRVSLRGRKLVSRKISPVSSGQVRKGELPPIGTIEGPQCAWSVMGPNGIGQEAWTGQTSRQTQKSTSRRNEISPGRSPRTKVYTRCKLLTNAVVRRYYVTDAIVA